MRKIHSNRRKLLRSLALVAGFLLVGAARVQAGDVDEQKRKLQEIEADIRQHREEAQKLKREEKSVVEQLGNLDREIALSEKYLKTVREQEAFLESQLEGLRTSVALQDARLEEQRRRLAARLRQMYKRGPNYRWEMILGSANVQDALRRSKFMGIIAERDANLVQQVSDHKRALQSEQAQITETLADLFSLRTARLNETENLQNSKRERVGMLNRIRKEGSEHSQAIEELNKSKKKMQDLIEALERKRLSGHDELPAGEFAKLKGRLPWPVSGKVTKRFGKDRHPEFGTVTFNNGINIRADAGSPIRAVAPGKVEFVDWISGYGNCIILNHGDGYYTLYAHAADIFVAPGASVSGGDVIAEVGDSGSLDGFICHFEVRKSKQALDPSDWLRK